MEWVCELLRHLWKMTEEKKFTYINSAGGCTGNFLGVYKHQKFENH